MKRHLYKRQWSFCLCLGLAMILFVSSVIAVQTKPFQIRALYQNHYPNMRTVASFSPTLSKKNEYLKINQFRISENDQEANIFGFLPPRVAKEGSSTVFLIDQSRSVLNKLDPQKTVLRNYLNQMDWNDQIAIVGFDDDIVHYILDTNNSPAFSSDRLKILRAVNEVQVRPQRDLITYRFKALKEGLKLLDQSGRKNRYLVMITDDNDDNTDQRLRALDSLFDDNKINHFENSLKNDHIKMYTMIMQDTEEWRRNADINNILRRLSLESGGKIYESLHDENDLNSSLLDASLLTFPDMDVEAYATFFLVHQDLKSTTESWLNEVQKGLQSHLKYLHIKDKMALVKTNKPFSIESNPVEISNTITSNISILDKDDVFKGVQIAHPHLDDLSILRKYLVIVLPENHERLPIPEDSETLLEQYKKSGISVSVITRGKLNQPFLSKLVRQTYGHQIVVSDQESFEVGIARFYDWLYHSYNLEYVSALSIEENAFKRIRLRVEAQTDEQVFHDTFTYILGITGFQLPKTIPGVWMMLLLALFLILFLIVLLSFNKKKKRRSVASGVHQCQYCRSPIPPDNLSCPHCGKPQYDTFEEQDQDESSIDSTQALSQSEKTRVIRKKKPSTAWVTIVSRASLGETFSLIEGEKNEIGRNTSNNIVIDDPSVSKMHAIIFSLGKDFVIHDCASQNQTILNGQPVDRAILKDNDIFEIGETILVFKQVKIFQRKGE